MFAVAVTTTLIVTASVKLVPKITTFVPSIFKNETVVFNVYVIVSLHAGC